MEFIDKIQNWLSSPDRDYEEGALLVLKANRNRIMYNNFMRRPEYYAEHIEYQLRKYLKSATADITHEQVAAMEKKAEQAMQFADKDAKGKVYGKRPDHDNLPDEIQALYVENFSIMSRMRECHLLVRQASGPNQACVDSDKFPFLEELLKLDIKLHDNWAKYDAFGKPSDAKDPAENEKKTLQLLKMAIGKYRKNPNNPAKNRIREMYAKIPDPGKKVTDAMIELDLLENA